MRWHGFRALLHHQASLLQHKAMVSTGEGPWSRGWGVLGTGGGEAGALMEVQREGGSSSKACPKGSSGCILGFCATHNKPITDKQSLTHQVGRWKAFPSEGSLRGGGRQGLQPMESHCELEVVIRGSFGGRRGRGRRGGVLRPGVRQLLLRLQAVRLD